MKRGIILFVFLMASFLYARHADGQKNRTFQRDFGGPNNEFGSSIVPLPDKGFMISGVTNSYGAGGYDILLIRTDSTGKKIWSQTYGGPLDEGIDSFYVNFSADLVLAPNGNIAVCSSTKSYGSGKNDIYFFEVDLDGNQIWAKTFGGSNEDYGMSLLNDPHGGFIIAGETFSYGAGKGDVCLLKTDKDGNLIWASTYGSSSVEEAAFRVSASRDGGFLVCGFSLTKLDLYDQLIMKVDASGNLEWSRVYGTTSYDLATSVVELPDQSIYVGGVSFDSIYRQNAIGIVTKLDGSGNKIWSKTYDPMAHSGIRTMLYDSIKHQFNASGSFYTSPAVQQVGILRIDTAGHFIFDKMFGPTLNANSNYTLGMGHDIVQLPSGAFMSLLSYTFNNQQWDCYLIKSDSAANPGPCFLTNVALHPFLATPFIGDHSYLFTKQIINPNISKPFGSKVNNIKDTLLCIPFVADFGVESPCFGKNAQFFDSSGSNPTTWLWDFGDAASSSNTSTAQNPVHLFSVPGNFRVKLISGNGSDKDSIIKTITVHGAPTHQPLTTITICHGEFAKLELHGLSGSTINWGIPNELNDSAISIKPTNDTLIIANVTSSVGCVDLDSFSVKYGAYTIDLGHDTTLCPGEVMLLKATGIRGTKFLWSTGSSDSILFVSKPGKYTVKVLSGNCEYDGAVNIYYISFPDKVLPPDTVLCDGYSIHIDLNNYRDTMIWQDANKNHEYDITAGGTYSVVFKNGCGQKKYSFSVRDSDCACTVFVPNAFTPGNDGHNDQFKAISACVPVSFQMEVFNRWGERVFQSNDIQKGWDGRFHGTICLDGVYFWQVYSKYPASPAKLQYGMLNLER